MAALGKLAIVGAGSVGTAIAYASIIQGIADEVVIYDLNDAKALAEVLDLRHGLQFVPPGRVDGGDDLACCADADVVVVTAGAKQHPGQSRMDLAAANTAMARTLVPELLSVAPEAVLLIVTNPVDVVTWAAHDASGLADGRVLGSGTVLDTSRLRFLIAQRLRVALSSVHATVVGEHGDTEIALWSSATVGGAPITSVVGPDGHTVGLHELDDLLHEVRNAAYRIIEGKGATNLAIGLATTRILLAIGSDERAVLPVTACHRLDGPGSDPVWLSLPSVVGRQGVVSTLDVPMDAAERAGLRSSAAAIRSVYEQVSER
jgi:L-lactate dehydrogenase